MDLILERADGPKFDGYSATTEGISWQTISDAIKRPGDTEVPIRGQRFFTHGIRILDAERHQIGTIYSGGINKGLVNTEVLGPRTPEFVLIMREHFPHTCVRVDSCVDFDQPHAFAKLLKLVGEVKKRHGLYGERRGDWDKPEKGLTQTLGAPKNPNQVHLYMKGRQPGFTHLNRPNLVRIEARVRPKGRAAQLRFATCTPEEVWGATKWTRELAEAILEHPVRAVRSRPVWKQTDNDRALSWMLKQYGRRLEQEALALGGWQVLGLTLKEVLSEVRRKGG